MVEKFSFFLLMYKESELFHVNELAGLKKFEETGWYFALLCDSKNPQVNKQVISSAQSSNKHSNLYQLPFFSMPDLPDFQNATGQVLAAREMVARKKSYSWWAKWMAVALFPNTDSETFLGKPVKAWKDEWCYSVPDVTSLWQLSMVITSPHEMAPGLCWQLWS